MQISAGASLQPLPRSGLSKATKGRGWLSATLSFKFTLSPGSRYLQERDALLAVTHSTSLCFKGTDRLWLSSLPSQIQTLELLVNGILPG